MILSKYMNKEVKKVLKKPIVEKVLSTLKNRDAVGSIKKGVNLASIAQKLFEKKAKELETEPSDGAKDVPQK